MIIIGEKINATRKTVKEAVENEKVEFLIDLAQKQANRGADYIDVNISTGKGSGEDEKEKMKWAVRLIEKVIDKPLVIDSSDPKVLRAGLESCKREPIINSTTAEENKLKEVMPLAAEFKVPIIALAMGGGDISSAGVESRLKACGKIVEAAKANGINLENIYFDPVVVPISTDISQGRTALEVLSEIKSKYKPAKTVIGLSNLSFGLPARTYVNQSFLTMAMYLGLDAAIMDPLDEKLTCSLLAARAVLGEDQYCRDYIKAYRKGVLK